ncbi:double-stranded RNA binding motif domain-containing protein [Sporobolomyces salmoneus]|uniref:double-stranded RNA binding motif domain-containing protein n=1 Tax=Sporobolomyces salmoneus TaxID=183962 RepID=UPI0031700B86
MVGHRAAIRAAAVVTKIRQNTLPIASTSSSNSNNQGSSRRTSPIESPTPGQWVNPYPRESRYTAASKPVNSPPLNLPKPPFVEVLDPAVFSHPSLTGDPRTFRFEKPENVVKKWDRRVESFERMEHFGKSLLRMTLTELVTNHYASLTVPAVESLVNKLLSDSHLLDLSDHYSLSSRLVADPLASECLRFSSSVKISLFYAYAAGIYHQEGISYASQWIRQCFRNGLDEEYRSMKKELFPKDVRPAEPTPLPSPSSEEWKATSPPRDVSPPTEQPQGKGKGKETEKQPRNQNPIVPDVMPLVQLDAYYKRNRLRAPQWSYAVKGTAPDQEFRAELKIGDATVQASGKTKNWARQTAAATFLGIKDIHPQVFIKSGLSLYRGSYTPRLFELTDQLGLPRPEFQTVINPKDPHYKCTLKVADKVFVTEGLGKVAVRREASRQALEYFDSTHKIETRLFEYIRSHLYSISFTFFEKTSTTESSDNKEVVWICNVKVREEGERNGSEEEVAEVFARGKNKFFARREAIVRAAEIFNLNKDSGSSEGTSRTEEQLVSRNRCFRYLP